MANAAVRNPERKCSDCPADWMAYVWHGLVIIKLSMIKTWSSSRELFRKGQIHLNNYYPPVHPYLGGCFRRRTRRKDLASVATANPGHFGKTKATSDRPVWKFYLNPVSRPANTVLRLNSKGWNKHFQMINRIGRISHRINLWSATERTEVEK